MRSICFKNSMSERRENEKSDKNSSLFSKKRHNHYLILSYKQNKENSLKLWATTTFERRFDVFVFAESRSFLLSERCLRRSSRTSSKIRRRLWIKDRLRNDASLRRSERRDFFLFWAKEFAERRLIWRTAAWSAILVDVVLWRCHFVVLFVLLRLDNVVLLITHRLSFLLLRWFDIDIVSIFFEICVDVLSRRVRFFVVILVVVIIVVIIIVIIILEFIIMIERKIMSTCWAHERILVKTQEQRRHFSLVTKNVNQNINDRRVTLDNLNLFDVNFRRINRIMMQTHSTSLSNRRFDDFLSSRRRLTESTTLRDSWIVFDDVQNLTLKQKNVQIWIHSDRNLTDNKLTERRAKVMTYSQNRMICSERHSANIERASVSDMNQIANCVLAYCIEDNKLQSMIVWISDVKAKDWRRSTFMTTTILRWYFQKKKTFQNNDKTEKTSEKDLIYVSKTKITSLFISLYELRYLLINDIMRSISRWQQSVIKQKTLTATAERRIRYSISITRHFTQTKSFEQQTHVSN